MLGERHPNLSPVFSKEKSYSLCISILRDRSCVASQSGQDWYGDVHGRETVRGYETEIYSSTCSLMVVSTKQFTLFIVCLL